MKAMSEQSAIDFAVKRLALALDALDAAVERRRDADRNEEALASQLQTLGLDRTRLAAALDGETARSRQLEATNREIAAAARYRDCLDPVGAERVASSDAYERKCTRHHCRPPVPPRLRGRAGGAFAGAGARFDQRIIDLRAKFGEIGDTRLTVMAALMVADELAETMRRVRRLEEEVAALQDARAVAADRAKAASTRWSTPSIRPPSASKASPASSTRRRSATAWRLGDFDSPLHRRSTRASAVVRAPDDHDDLGADIAVVRPGEVEIVLPYSGKILQQHAFIHAGAVATIADTA